MRIGASALEEGQSPTTTPQWLLRVKKRKRHNATKSGVFTFVSHLALRVEAGGI